jgi:hypothetical protein
MGVWREILKHIPSPRCDRPVISIVSDVLSGREHVAVGDTADIVDLANLPVVADIDGGSAVAGAFTLR